jgi:anaerobic selenocysteine-containing dehydrogenase
MSDDRPIVQFGDLDFPTPSGRVEIASWTAAADGHGRLPKAVADERPGAGRLRLLSPASPWSLNASFGNDERVQRRSGELTISLNRADAAALGLSEGALAHVSSAAGELVVPAQVTDALPPGVALIPKGAWPKRRPDGANVNVLTRAQRSDMGASTAVHGLEVVVTPAGAKAPT